MLQENTAQSNTPAAKASCDASRRQFINPAGRGLLAAFRGSPPQEES